MLKWKSRITSMHIYLNPYLTHWLQTISKSVYSDDVLA